MHYSIGCASQWVGGEVDFALLLKGVIWKYLGTVLVERCYWIKCVEDREAAKYPAMHRTDPQTEKLFSLKCPHCG